MWGIEQIKRFFRTFAPVNIPNGIGYGNNDSDEQE